MATSNQLEAKYANYFQVGQNALEFVIEFGQLYAGDKDLWLHTRIVTNPIYMKHLLLLVQQALHEHEERYGPIRQADV